MCCLSGPLPRSSCVSTSECWHSQGQFALLRVSLPSLLTHSGLSPNTDTHLQTSRSWVSHWHDHLCPTYALPWRPLHSEECLVLTPGFPSSSCLRTLETRGTDLPGSQLCPPILTPVAPWLVLLTPYPIIPFPRGSHSCFQKEMQAPLGPASPCSFPHRLSALRFCSRLSWPCSQLLKSLDPSAAPQPPEPSSDPTSSTSF